MTAIAWQVVSRVDRGIAFNNLTGAPIIREGNSGIR